MNGKKLALDYKNMSRIAKSRHSEIPLGKLDLTEVIDFVTLPSLTGNVTKHAVRIRDPIIQQELARIDLLAQNKKKFISQILRANSKERYLLDKLGMVKIAKKMMEQLRMLSYSVIVNISTKAL